MPLSVFLFDVLHLDGADLIDLPDAERRAALAGVVPTEMLMPRLVTGDADEADAFFRDAVARGHEGVVVKSLATPYAAGRRGAGWIKVKPRHTLDLVVLAVEWGHGRRKGWLSNLHLGARDPETGGWVMLGKTFKGLTDELLTWQTARLLELEDHRDDWTVYVRPELVVEIAFDGVQRSPRYPGGVALRFARVIRYREDKPAAEADTIDAVLRPRRRVTVPSLSPPSCPAFSRSAPSRPWLKLLGTDSTQLLARCRVAASCCPARRYFFFLLRLPKAAGMTFEPVPGIGGRPAGPRPPKPGKPPSAPPRPAGPPPACASRSISASSSIDCGVSCAAAAAGGPARPPRYLNRPPGRSPPCGGRRCGACPSRSSPWRPWPSAGRRPPCPGSPACPASRRPSASSSASGPRRSS